MSSSAAGRGIDELMKCSDFSTFHARCSELPKDQLIEKLWGMRNHIALPADHECTSRSVSAPRGEDDVPHVNLFRVPDSYIPKGNTNGGILQQLLAANESFSESFSGPLDMHDEPRKKSKSSLALEALPPGTEKHHRYVRLKDLYFYQDYISGRFSDGRSLETTINQLRSKEVAPETLPLIDALRWKGRWYAIGNRRAACFHIVFGNDPNFKVPVMARELPDDAAMLPQGTGTTMAVGGGALINGQLISRVHHCAHT